MLMPRYLFQVSYTHEGIQGIKKEGGSSRADLVGKMLADLGGSLEAYYFAFGEDDVVVIADLPDHVSAAAIGITVGASGAATTKTTVLLTPEEIDAASKKSVSYRPPGA
jgi:uncharacterized protein with GYD domain